MPNTRPLPFDHVHVGDADIAVAAAAQPDQGKVLEKLAADGTGAHHEILLAANLVLEVFAEYCNLAVVPAESNCEIKN